MKRRALSKPKLQHMQIMKGKHDEIFVFIFLFAYTNQFASMGL